MLGFKVGRAVKNKAIPEAGCCEMKLGLWCGGIKGEVGLLKGGASVR